MVAASRTRTNWHKRAEEHGQDELFAQLTKRQPEGRRREGKEKERSWSSFTGLGASKKRARDERQKAFMRREEGAWDVEERDGCCSKHVQADRTVNGSARVQRDVKGATRTTSKRPKTTSGRMKKEKEREKRSQSGVPSSNRQAASEDSNVHTERIRSDEDQHRRGLGIVVVVVVEVLLARPLNRHKSSAPSFLLLLHSVEYGYDYGALVCFASCRSSADSCYFKHSSERKPKEKLWRW